MAVVSLAAGPIRLGIAERRIRQRRASCAVRARNLARSLRALCLLAAASSKPSCRHIR